VSDERQEPKTGDTSEAEAAATDELEDLSPSKGDSETVTGGSSGGWDRVENPIY
jgi:hypothetical protein